LTIPVKIVNEAGLVEMIAVVIPLDEFKRLTLSQWKIDPMSL
jgi:hypothetical protein